MYTAREAFADHIATSDLDISQVKSYQGEIRDAIEKPAILKGLLRSVLVLFVQGQTRSWSRLDALVITSTKALKGQKNASDALELAEGLANWLEEHFTWRDADDAYAYDIDLTQGIQVDTLLVISDYTIMRLGVTVRETDLST